MKAAVKRLKSRQPRPTQIVACFFFNAKGSLLERSRIGFLRSIIYQIIQQNARLRALFIRRVCEDINFNDLDIIEARREAPRLRPEDSDPSATGPWAQDDLQTFLLDAIRQLEDISLVLFVDALDECISGEEDDNLAYFLHDLTVAASEARTIFDVCIASRNWGSVTLKHCAWIQMDQCNRQDIEHCVRNMLSAAGMGTHPTGKWTKLCTSIVEKSAGVFLWAKLVVELLRKERENGADVDRLQLRINDVPQQLERLYAELLGSYSSSTRTERDIATRLFQWAIFSLEPLRLKDWRNIMAFITTTESTERTSLEAIGLAPPVERNADEILREYGIEDINDPLVKRIRSISRGLVEVVLTPESLEHGKPHLPLVDGAASLHGMAGSVDSDQGDTMSVQLIHESVRHFMLSPGFSLLNERIGANPSRHGHLFISNMCLDFINIKELDEYINATRSAAFENPSLAGCQEVVRLSEALAETRNSSQRSINDPSFSAQYDLAFLNRRGSVESFGSAASAEARPPVTWTPDNTYNYNTLEQSTISKTFSELAFNTPQDFEIKTCRTDSFPRMPFSIPSPVSTRVASTRPPSSGGRLLKLDIALLFYAKNRVFQHLLTAVHFGAELGPIMHRLNAEDNQLWNRWMLLQYGELSDKISLADLVHLSNEEARGARN